MRSLLRGFTTKHVNEQKKNPGISPGFVVLQYACLGIAAALTPEQGGEAD